MKYRADILEREVLYINNETLLPEVLTDNQKLISSIYNSHSFVELYRKITTITAKTKRQLNLDVYSFYDSVKRYDYEVYIHNNSK